MPHYDFSVTFRFLYDKAVDLYGQGGREAGAFFSADESAWLAANGLTAQHLFDYAEDQLKYSEPGVDLALGIEFVRRSYFTVVQQGRASAGVLDEASLPAKTDAVNGIEWLPRIIPKTRAKLRGELPSSLMYCCGGDRKFFKAHDINPVEFLLLVWQHGQDDKAVVEWVTRRSRTR